jgi:hypothetical protein
MKSFASPKRLLRLISRDPSASVNNLVTKANVLLVA